ncbi:MAG TPA: hypothetical protein VGK32_20235 [Vicinamibacterales bacterium]|jgi:hypothetical protein
MSDFNVRSDSVNVEQLMQQIRARIREKRGVDYTEAQIRELASVKLERFLDPTKVRSELLQQFRTGGIDPLPDYGFEENTLFESHRAPLRWIRRVLRPLMMLFLNINRLIHSLHTQVQINRHHAEYTQLSYELIHNLVLETTRLGIEVKNLKMRVESLSSRLDFSERRARALEGVVQYRPGEVPTADAKPAPGSKSDRTPAGGSEQPPRDADQGSAEQRRRRRRRRGRRGGAARSSGPEGAVNASPAANEADEERAEDTLDFDGTPAQPHAQVQPATQAEPDTQEPPSRADDRAGTDRQDQ